MKKLSENKFSENEVITILNNSPELSRAQYQGLDCLHYAILSNNAKLVSIILKFAIKNGLKEFPETQITADSKYANNQGILKFSYKQNKLNSFISLFEFGVFDEKSIKELAALSMVDLNNDFNSFFRKIYGNQIMNELNNEIFKQQKHSELLIGIIVEAKGSIKTLKKFGYDFFTPFENGTLLHNVFKDYSKYKLDTELKNPIVSLDNKNKHLTIDSLFFESVLFHKELQIKSKDHEEIPLYILLEKHIRQANFTYGLGKIYETTLQEKILEATMPKNKTIETTPRPLKF